MELEPRTTAPGHATGAVQFVELATLAGDVTFRLREEGDVSTLAASMGRLGQLVPVELRVLPGSTEWEPRYQLVAGFRRVAALRLLRRERVLARVHQALGDEDAWGLALSLGLLAEPLDPVSLGSLRERLLAGGLAPWADELVDEALVRAPVEPGLRERFLKFLALRELGPDAELGPVEEEEGEEEGEEEPAAEEEEQRELAALDGGTEEEPVQEEEPSDSMETVEMTPEELAADLTSRLYQVNEDLAVAVEAWAELPAEGRRAIVEQARWMAELLPLLEEDGEEGS